MKEYLHQLFHRGGYEAQDAAYLLRVYDRMQADETAARCMAQAAEEYDKDACDYGRLITLADEAAASIGAHEYTVEWLVYMVLSKTLLARYRERGIDETVFWNSMLDLKYKLEECKAVKGVVGSFVAFWFEGFFNLTRFALGRLQFETMPFGHTYERDGKMLTPDSKVINVHIPRTGTPLLPAECEDAYKQAAAFFGDEIGDDVAFTCYSWLLYPENETILGDHSNIVRFMKRYDVFQWGIDKNKRDLWRLFDTDESHPDRLPTDTTARRLYAEHIRRGGKLGWGHGVFFY